MLKVRYHGGIHDKPMHEPWQLLALDYSYCHIGGQKPRNMPHMKSRQGNHCLNIWCQICGMPRQTNERGEPTHTNSLKGSI